MAIEPRSPLSGIQGMREALDRLFGEPLFRSREIPARVNEGSILLDAYLTEHEVVIQASFPGLTVDAVELMTVGDLLTITGAFHRPIENVEYIIRELPHGKISRSITLNIPLELEQAEASFANGVLTIEIPRKPETGRKSITIRSR